MRPDKVLIPKTTVENYQNESNFEYITIYLPQEYNGQNILDYTIQLNITNSNAVGDVITLTDPALHESKYEYKFPIPLKWTNVPGKIFFWLKFIKANDVVGITNKVHVMISKSDDITEFIPESSLSLLDEWTLTMNGINDEVQHALSESKRINTSSQEVLNDIIQIKTDIENISTNPPIIGDNGNWFIWSKTDNDYIDSGIQAKLDINTTVKDNYWLMFGDESVGDT